MVTQALRPDLVRQAHVPELDQAQRVVRSEYDQGTVHAVSGEPATVEPKDIGDHATNDMIVQDRSVRRGHQLTLVATVNDDADAIPTSIVSAA